MVLFSVIAKMWSSSSYKILTLKVDFGNGHGDITHELDLCDYWSFKFGEVEDEKRTPLGHDLRYLLCATNSKEHHYTSIKHIIDSNQ